METHASSAAITALVQQHTGDAITALVEALRCPGERVAAAQALLAVGWGQPTLPIAIDSVHGLVIEFRDGHPHVRANGEGRAAHHAA